MISNSAETSRAVHFGREDAMTYEERVNAGWQVKFIAWVAGFPSILAVAFTGIVGLWYAWIFTADTQTWLAVSAGLVAITMFAAGLPIPWALTRGHNGVVANAALGLWIACVAMNFGIMAHFARHVPAPAGPGHAVARDMAEDEAYDLDTQIESVRDAIAEGAELTKARGGSPYYQRRRHELQAELLRLETKRYGSPVTKAAPARPGSQPGLDLAAIALIMIAGSAVGLLISAGSLAAIMTAKVREMHGQAANAGQVQAAGLIAQDPHHPAENADGFENWSMQCVSKVQGGQIRTGEAHAHYLTFCARNDYSRPLAVQEFGRRLRGWLAHTHAVDGRHSNGTVFDGVALSQMGHALAAPVEVA